MDNARVENIRSEWEAKGFKSELWTSPPGNIWSDPGHEADEVLILLEGEMEVTLGGKTFRPQIGEEIVIPAGEPHSVKNPGSTPNRLYWIRGYHYEPGGG